MDDKLRHAKDALRQKDGKTALEIAYQILEQDETCCEAWFIAMQCFQLIVPIDEYNPENELTCARYAIRYAPKEKKYLMRKQVYLFLMGITLVALGVAVLVRRGC